LYTSPSFVFKMPVAELISLIILVSVFYVCGVLVVCCNKGSCDEKTVKEGLNVGGIIGIGFLTLALYGNFHTALVGPIRLRRASAWTTGGTWMDDTCEVLAAGVASRGRCPSATAASLGIDSYSVCPGWTKCSDEGGQCMCSGDVAYGSGLYYRGDSPDWKGTLRKESVKGPINCTNAAFGSDPAPYTNKYCWCLSSARLDLIAQTKAGPVDSQRCELEGDAAYTRAADSSILTAEEGDPIRLSSGFSEAHGGLTNPMSEFDELIEEDQEKDVEDEALPGQVELLETGDGYDNRRRGGCKSVYSPWALVKVSAGVFTVGERTRLRCAYSYGAETVSREEEEKPTQSRYRTWEQATGSEIPCTAHDDCTIALTPLESITRDEIAKTQKAWEWSWSILLVAFMVSTVSGLFAVYWQSNSNSCASPVEPMVWAACNFLFILVVGIIGACSDVVGTGSINVLVVCLSTLTAALLQGGWPLLIIRFVHPNGADMFTREQRHRNLQAASPPARFLVRRASTLRTSVTGGRSLHQGDEVILTEAVGNLPADTQGRIVGMDGANMVFMDEGGETVQVLGSQLRLAAF